MSVTSPTLSKAKKLPAHGVTDAVNAASEFTGGGWHDMISARRPLKPLAKAEETAGMGAAWAPHGF